MFLDGFDVLKLHLNRLPAKAAKVSGSHFWKKKTTVYRGETLEEKNTFFNSRYLRVSN